ncbi:type I pullulanase [Facklamia sp. DSM 111019]|uniref:type I pullulanase n=1 Tax=Facklamia lactis TaxID=2749967 RepID=UPI0018CDADAF|nr:type I pullulanase [Facklamia lactis]MBG9980300.1 type I pullulanase [Facklamia lactis]
MVHEPMQLDQFYYDGALGALYQEQYTLFRVWAPTALSVELVLFEGYYGRPKRQIQMFRKQEVGIFEAKLDGDQHGLTYRYRLTFAEQEVNETVDPYGKAVTVNGRRSVVVDLSRTDPSNWGERMPAFSNPLDAVIYEVHVRDLTIAKNSGINHKGKFLGLAESGTQSKMGLATGLDYIVSLGVTHVELLPIFDFQTVDETIENPLEYNWGYDPQNYQSVEGSYATDPYDPFCRITELKSMIQAFHDKGLRVIMDVVFNHVYEVESHAFQLTVPKYYFRYNRDGELTNGTGVGNDTASERLMMRKYILDSIKFWAEEYQIDGFRFDLMGIHDLQTMNQVRELLDEIDPSILIIGEGWNMYTPLPTEEQANSLNAKGMPRIGQFNDGIREAIKGNDFDAEARGFINGAWYMEEKLVNNLLAHYDSYLFSAPNQVVQYCEAHDNYTLYDRLVKADPFLAKDIIIKQQELALSLVLLAQGIPFIHAGQEFLRTKFGIRDSYNRPNMINQIDWDRPQKYQHTVEYTRQLIQLRKQESLLRQTTFEEIHQTAEIIQAYDLIVALRYAGEGYDLLLIFNGNREPIHFNIKRGDYYVLVEDGVVDLQGNKKYTAVQQIEVSAYSTTVLKKINN